MWARRIPYLIGDGRDLERWSSSPAVGVRHCFVLAGRFRAAHHHGFNSHPYCTPGLVNTKAVVEGPTVTALGPILVTTIP